MPNRLKMWMLKSRSYFLLVQSKIWTARCHRDWLNFCPAEAWLHGCVVTRGRLQTDIGFTNRKFNQHCVNVALRTNLKKDDAQHNDMVSSKCCQTLGSSSGTEGWTKFWYLLLEAWNLGKLDSWSLKHAEPGMYAKLCRPIKLEQMRSWYSSWFKY